MGDTAEPNPVISVSMGDPGGIGPEVTAKAIRTLAEHPGPSFVLYGWGATLNAWNARVPASDGGPADPWPVASDDASARAMLDDGRRVVLVDVDAPEDAADPDEIPAQPDARAGEASFAFVERAIGAARAHSPVRARAICTAPISKTSWALAGRTSFPGHTELLADRFGVGDRFAMVFIGPTLRVSLVTVHEPLSRVPGLLTEARVRSTIELTEEACALLGIRSPRIGVCGLNPHAGEGGLLGHEDERVIAPAIEHAARAGIDATGPFPADTLFLAAARGGYDAVVAMYHDQGLIPVKLLDRDEAVNVTIGLPVPRTSPAHGTAFDIAGRGRADPGSMLASLRLAARMGVGPV